MRDDRVRVLDMSPRFLLRFLATGEHPPYRVVQDAVPGDAEIIGCEHNWHGSVRFYIWSATFDVVPEGNEPPHLTPAEQSIDRWPTQEVLTRMATVERESVNAAGGVAV